jgi:hypothetical protein
LALKLKPHAKVPSFEMEGLQDKDGRADMEEVSDSDFGADQETRNSVFGWNLYFCGAMNAWKSKASNSVTLSSTEAEYVALSKITKEVIFVKQVLETMGIGVKAINYHQCGHSYLFKQQLFIGTENQTHRYEETFCKRICGRWDNQDKVCWDSKQ